MPLCCMWEVAASSQRWTGTEPNPEKLALGDTFAYLCSDLMKCLSVVTADTLYLLRPCQRFLLVERLRVHFWKYNIMVQSYM